MDRILKLLNDLKIEKVEQWKRINLVNNKNVYFYSFKVKKAKIVISSCDFKTYRASKLSKKDCIDIYEGYSFEVLESAIRKEVGNGRTQNQ